MGVHDGLPDETRAILGVLKHLPPGSSLTLTVGVDALREALTRTDPDRDLSSAEAAAEFGHSPPWWSRRGPKVPGAYQAAEGGPWSFRASGCRAYLAGLQRKMTRKGRRGPRGPNRSTGADSLSARRELRGGPETVEGGAADAA